LDFEFRGLPCGSARTASANPNYFDMKIFLETFCEASMGFIVQSVSNRPGEPPFRVTKATRKDALETAIGFLGQGMENVSIVDEKGRVFSTHEFSLVDDD
jgi:hypothetical protein